MLRRVYNKLFPNRIKGKNNTIRIHKPGKNIRIRINGNNNSVIIEEAACLTNLTINIEGDNNVLKIHKNCRIYGPCKILIENGSTIEIGENTGLRGVTILANSAPIYIGENCMTSYEVIIRNHDSHSIYDLESNEKVNHPKAITIGNKVWIGQRVTILKGVSIGNDCVIGFGSIVTRDIPHNSIATGIPASTVKQGIRWEK